MITSYATKRDTYGNRYYLIIDSNKREYATISNRWYCREDFIEVSKTDYRKIKNFLIDAGYAEVYSLNPGFVF